MSYPPPQPVGGAGCPFGCSGSTGWAGSLLGQFPGSQKPQAAPQGGTTWLPNPGHIPGLGTHESLPVFPLHISDIRIRINALLWIWWLIISFLCSCMDEAYLEWSLERSELINQCVTFCRAALMSKVDPCGRAVDAGQRQQGEAQLISPYHTLKSTHTPWWLMWLLGFDFIHSFNLIVCSIKSAILINLSLRLKSF